MPGRIARGQAPGILVKRELKDRVGPSVGDVRHERKSVGPVCLDGVGPVRRVAPFDGRDGSDPAAVHGVDRNGALVVIGREHKPAASISRHVHRLALQRRRPYEGESSRALVDPVTRNLLLASPAHIEKVLAGSDG